MFCLHALFNLVFQFTGGALTSLTGRARSAETISSVEKGRAVLTLRPITTIEYNCPLCDKTTKNQNPLDLHLIAIHFKKEYRNPENKCEIFLQIEEKNTQKNRRNAACLSNSGGATKYELC